MPQTKWYRELTPYQWRVLICACLGWALDIMDGYLYAIILFPAMTDLLGTSENAVIGWYGGIVLGIFMIGWALGGLIFGPIADRYGRARTMAITILVYAGFTGLCAAAGSWQELAFYRFMTGLGIGGEWSAGAALIAETWPPRARAKAAGIMQASGGLGFFLASLLYLFSGSYGWRWVFALGILPAVLAFYIRRTLDEPERWLRAEPVGNPLRSLFIPPVGRDVLVGTALAVIATFGYQGAIQWVPSWVSALLHAQGPRAVIPQVSLVTSVAEWRGHPWMHRVSTGGRPLRTEARTHALLSRGSGCSPGYLLLGPGFFSGGRDFTACGLFRRRRIYRLRNLSSRAVSHVDTRYRARILLQRRALLLRSRAVRRGKPYLGSRFVFPRHCIRRVGLSACLDNPSAGARN